MPRPPASSDPKHLNSSAILRASSLVPILVHRQNRCSRAVSGPVFCSRLGQCHGSGPAPCVLACAQRSPCGSRPSRTSRQANFAMRKEAIQAIDDAINEIKKVSIDDGKDLNDHPPVEAGLDYTGRLHRAKELLEKRTKTSPAKRTT